MGICVVRTGGRLPARADAGTIEPRLDVAALPDTSTGTLGIALSPAISAFRVLKPVQSKAITDEPFAEIGAVDRTSRNGAAISVEAERDAVDGAPRNVSVEVICRLGATAGIGSYPRHGIAGCSRARRCPIVGCAFHEFPMFAINNAGLTDKIVGQSPAR